MSSGIKTDPMNGVRTALQGSRPRHASIQDISKFSSRGFRDDDLSSQESFSLSSSLPHGARTSHELDWTLAKSESIESSPLTLTKPETPDVQMMSYTFSQQLLPTSTAHSNVAQPMFHSLSELQAIQGVGDHNELDLSQPQDFQNFSMVDFTFDNDTCLSDGNQQCCPDDDVSVGHSSHTDDHQMVTASGNWGSLALETGDFHALEHLSTNIFQAPVSPPLTEESNVSVTSACSQSGFPSFRGHEETLLGDGGSAIGSQNIGLTDSFFPLTPPLSDQDPNRTIRPSKQAQRPLLSAAASRSPRKSDPEFYTSLARDPLRQRSKDGPEVRAPRDHPFYSLPTRSDGKYYCPYANGEKPCNHTPTTQKCAYHKYLDSHLKPYRCKVPACMDAQLQFSSNACLFRHEREAHGFHGHGDNPHLCLFEGCDRSIPGYGFPRRWNLFDHMKRVHEFVCEQPSSPETSPTGQGSKKKDPSGRKRKVTGTISAQTMKRTRSASSQANSLKVAHASAHHGQRLQNAERNYYNCRSRLLEELSSINPQDPAMHEKVNASLQELITLGLNYRHIEASQAPTQMATSLSA